MTDAVKSTKEMPIRTKERAKYPWADLVSVGDSFFFPDDDTCTRQTKICSAAIQHGERVGKTYITEVGEKDGVKGVYVWLESFRVEPG